MADIQAIFCDLDGTFLNSNHEVSDYNQRAVKALMAEKNIPFYVVTGRGMPAIDSIKSLKVDDLTGCFNGAVIKDYKTGKILKSYPIAPKDNKEIITIAKKHDFTCIWYCEDGVFCNKDDELAADYFHIAHLQPQFAHLDDFADKTIIKMIMKWHNEDILDEVRDYITDAKHLDLWGTYSLPNSLEVLNNKANKGEAVAFIAKHLGYDLNHCMAFGDNANDEPMLDKVGYGVVMENGRPSTVSKYPYKAIANDKDGVGRYLKEYFALQSL